MAKKRVHSKSKSSKTADRPLTVTLSGNRPIHDVAGDLKAAGFQVGQVLSEIGSVTGFAHPDLKDKLKRIKGVADVTEDHAPIDIGPPDAPVS